jgi:hypothetical protein
MVVFKLMMVGAEGLLLASEMAPSMAAKSLHVVSRRARTRKPRHPHVALLHVENVPAVRAETHLDVLGERHRGVTVNGDPYDIVSGLSAAGGAPRLLLSS